jgi:hypothetical protein
MAMPISMPQGMAYGWWHFPKQLLRDLTFDVEIVAGDERTPGRYYQLYQGQIGGQGMYLGFQTDLRHPSIGWQGKGLLFSRWGSRDNEDAEPVSGGWVENAGHEGDFVGVRSLFDWRVGRYCCWLSPAREETTATWYEFRVQRMSDVVQASAGALRFEYQNGERPLIHSGGGSWTEVYTGVSTVEEVPFTQFDVRCVRADSNSLAPIRCDTTYNPKFPAADSEYTAQHGLSLRSGRGVSQVHPARQYHTREPNAPPDRDRM